MKIQIEVFQRGRNIICQECSKPTRKPKAVYYHPSVDIHVYNGDMKHFKDKARLAIMQKLQSMGLSVAKLQIKQRAYNPRPRIPVHPKQIDMFKL